MLALDFVCTTLLEIVLLIYSICLVFGIRSRRLVGRFFDACCFPLLNTKVEVCNLRIAEYLIR